LPFAVLIVAACILQTIAANAHRSNEMEIPPLVSAQEAERNMAKRSHL
jgi:hypothetical protein